MFIQCFNDSEVFSKCELLIPKIPENNSKVFQKTRDMNVRLKESSTWYYFWGHT